MRKRPSAATIIAMIALFVSLSGTAIGAVIISNNSQVAAHVIAGADAPSGDHRNLIAGSVGTSDLHAGAVTGAKLGNASVSTSKLNLPKIDITTPDTDPNPTVPHHTVLSLGGLTLGIACYNDSGAVEEVVDASSAAPHAIIRELYFLNGGTAHQLTSALLPTAPGPSGFGFESDSGSVPMTGIFTYRDVNRVITITLSGVANHDTSTCSLEGTAVPAPN